MDHGSQSQPGHRRAASSFGSVLGLESLDDVTSGDQATGILVYDAYTIAAAYNKEILKKNKNAIIYIGVFLKALLDNASEKPVDPHPGVAHITGRRCTAAAIKVANAQNKIREVALTWLQTTTWAFVQSNASPVFVVLCFMIGRSLGVTLPAVEFTTYPMKIAASVRTAAPSEEQSRGLEIVEDIISPSSRSGQSLLRAQIIQRDNYRCCIHPGELDMSQADDLLDIPFQMLRMMQAAHIVPYALSDFDAKKNTQTGYHSAVTRTLIQNWTCIDIEKLAGSCINDPSNVLSLCHDAHAAFDQFTLHFQATETLHRYKVMYALPRELRQVDEVTFTNHSPDAISLPDPDYLAFHAAFARVLYASAAGKYFDSILRDEEEITVMASDGSTDVELLAWKLSQIPIH